MKKRISILLLTLVMIFSFCPTVTEAATCNHTNGTYSQVYSTGYTSTDYYQRPSGQSYNGQKIYDDYKRIYTTYIVYDKCRTCGYVVNSRYFEECTYDGRAY